MTNPNERRRRTMAYAWLLCAILLISQGPHWLDGGYVLPLWILGGLGLRGAVDLLAEAPRRQAPPAEDFGQREHERVVLEAAYRWRYDLAANGRPSDAVEGALVDAVDQWDMSRPHSDDGGPL